MGTPFVLGGREAREREREEAVNVRKIGVLAEKISFFRERW